ncbi:MAG: hypothetical protein WBC04_26530 [Candidatus Acidiferrales bacterium]
MGLYKKGRNWYMAYTANGHQYNHSTHTKNKRMAQKILDARLGEIAEGRFGLPKSNPPKFEVYAEQFLESIPHANTKTSVLIIHRQPQGAVRRSKALSDRRRWDRGIQAKAVAFWRPFGNRESRSCCAAPHVETSASASLHHPNSI